MLYYSKICIVHTLLPNIYSTLVGRPLTAHLTQPVSRLGVAYNYVENTFTSPICRIHETAIYGAFEVRTDVQCQSP